MPRSLLIRTGSASRFPARWRAATAPGAEPTESFIASTRAPEPCRSLTLTIGPTSTTAPRNDGWAGGGAAGRLSGEAAGGTSGGGLAACGAGPGGDGVGGGKGGVGGAEAEGAVGHRAARAGFLDGGPGAEGELVLERGDGDAGDGQRPGVGAGLGHRVVTGDPVVARRDAGAQHVVVAGQVHGGPGRGGGGHGDVDDRGGVTAGRRAAPVGDGVGDGAPVHAHAAVADVGAARVLLHAGPGAAQVVLVGQGRAGGRGHRRGPPGGEI